MNYIKKHHRTKWNYLTYVPLWGFGGRNGFRTIPFIYSKDDLGDPNVAELKKSYRSFLKLMLTVFFTTPILFFLFMDK